MKGESCLHFHLSLEFLKNIQCSKFGWEIYKVVFITLWQSLEVNLIDFIVSGWLEMDPRPRHFHCFRLFSVIESAKNWKCPGLGWISYSAPKDIIKIIFLDENVKNNFLLFSLFLFTEYFISKLNETTVKIINRENEESNMTYGLLCTFFIVIFLTLFFPLLFKLHAHLMFSVT